MKKHTSYYRKQLMSILLSLIRISSLLIRYCIMLILTLYDKTHSFYPIYAILSFDTLSMELAYCTHLLLFTFDTECCIIATNYPFNLLSLPLFKLTSYNSSYRAIIHLLSHLLCLMPSLSPLDYTSLLSSSPVSLSLLHPVCV